MKIVAVSMFLALFMLIEASGQKVTLNLSFTALENETYLQLDSIRVINRTQGDEYTLYFPDTTLTVEITAGDTLLSIGYVPETPVGLPEDHLQGANFRLFAHHPNPVVTESVFSLYLPEEGTVYLSVTDIQGKAFTKTSRKLGRGSHQFQITPFSDGYFLITATWNGISQRLKAISSGVIPGKPGSVEYIGSIEGESGVSRVKHILTDSFRESGILDTPSGNKNYLFQFGCNMPCPGIPTVEYEGQIYHTIQIFNQCWLKENLNVGNRIPASQEMTDNGILEKYCYDDNPDYCLLYGALYQWREAMRYTTQQGTEGICPPGWHIPTDEEWKVLEGTVDSQTGIGDGAWDWPGFRGYDAGKNLKSTSGWHNNGNGIDLFGFTGHPAGRSSQNGYFYDIAYNAFWWSSTEQSITTEWSRDFSWGANTSGRYGDGYRDGLSIRCIKN
jgi:uncharacterized protein (TIGR02145 family)